MTTGHNLCNKCAAEMRENGWTLRKVGGGVNYKVTCDRCGRRKYGGLFQTEQNAKDEG